MLKHYAPKPKPAFEKKPTDSLAEARLRYRRMLNADADPATLTDLDTSPIVPRKSLSEAMNSRRQDGHGRTYKLLCACAATGLKLGYPVGVTELTEIARQYSLRVGRKAKPSENMNDARKALRWAERQPI